jgi:hypothetical protein
VSRFRACRTGLPFLMKTVRRQVIEFTKILFRRWVAVPILGLRRMCADSYRPPSGLGLKINPRPFGMYIED